MSTQYEPGGLLPLDALRTDGSTQQRLGLDADTVEEYTQAMIAGSTFPPVVVFYDDDTFWLADGFHRVEAARRAGKTEIAGDVRRGNQRDAVLYAVGANSTHGLRRSNADKRQAVETLLQDPEWARWSDNEIARRCGVSQPFVSKLRHELTYNGYKSDLRVGADGRTINTANIGMASHADELRAHMVNAVRDSIKIGRELIEIRALLTREQWRLWQETEFDGIAPADNYIALAGRFGDVAPERLPAVAPLALTMLTDLPSLAIDPEFAALLPPLSQREQAGLAASLQTFGCIYELTTWRGTIVDGHQRYAICQRYSIPFHINEWQFEDRRAVKEWIVKMHALRRNLSDEQLAAMATYPTLRPKRRTATA